MYEKNGKLKCEGCSNRRSGRLNIDLGTLSAACMRC